MTTMHHARPSWYTDEDDSAWERVKDAFRRDWKQTKHDFGGNEPDLGQSAGDTISQATGSQPIPSNSMPRPVVGDEYDDVFDDEHETAYRYGFAAYRHLGSQSDWNQSTIDQLRQEWGDDADWELNHDAVRKGWMFAEHEDCKCHSGNNKTPDPSLF